MRICMCVFSFPCIIRTRLETRKVSRHYCARAICSLCSSVKQNYFLYRVVNLKQNPQIKSEATIFYALQAPWVTTFANDRTTCDNFKRVLVMSIFWNTIQCSLWKQKNPTFFDVEHRCLWLSGLINLGPTFRKSHIKICPLEWKNVFMLKTFLSWNKLQKIQIYLVPFLFCKSFMLWK